MPSVGIPYTKGIDTLCNGYPMGIQWVSNGYPMGIETRAKYKG